MIRYKYILLSLFFCLFFANQKTAGNQPVLKDTVEVQKIKVTETVLDEYRNNKSFQYIEKSYAPGLLERLLLLLSQWIGFQYLATAAPWLLYTILILAFIVLILVLFRSHFQGIFLHDKKEGINITRNEIDESVNFEELLNDALARNNYNLAVRYLYLILLRQLNTLKLISYKPGKTNIEYISEINNPEIVPLFRTVTRNYEYAWYGQFPLDQQAYRTIEDSCKNLTEKLHD